MSVVAIDWSGGRRGERQHLWTAEAHDGELQRLEAGRTRTEVVDELVARAADHPAVVVGLDFSFSLPAWFLDERGFTSARALWDAAVTDGEGWLRACEPPFWGRSGCSRPELPAHLRRAEAALAPVGGIRPKSSFQIGGAGSVGTGSVRGFPSLARLQDAGYAIWPFDGPLTGPAEGPVAVEIWPRTFTGSVVKSDPTARAAHLDAHLPGLDPRWRAAAVRSEDAFDAAVSAVAMSGHEADLRSLPALDDRTALTEGWIWSPDLMTRLARERGSGVAPIRPRARSAAARSMRRSPGREGR